MLEYFSAAGEATNEGIFIPVGDLSGLLATELEVGDSDEAKFAAFTYSFFKKLKASLTDVSYLTTQTVGNILGLTFTQADEAPEPNIHTVGMSLITQLLVNKGSQETKVLPLNGNNSGQLTFTAVFPNAAKVAAAGAVAGAGVVIPTEDIELFGSPAHADITLASDCRQVLTSIFGYCYAMATVRDDAGTISSAFTAKSRANTFPTLSTAITNAIPLATGIDTTYPSSYAIAQETLSLTIELVLNDNETHSPNIRVTPQ